MIQCTLTASTHDPRMLRYYERLKTRHKSIVALAHLASKLLRILWHMLTGNVTYEGANKARYQVKLKKIMAAQQRHGLDALCHGPSGRCAVLQGFLRVGVPSAPHRGLCPYKICILPHFLGFCHGSGDFVLGKVLRMPQAYPRWQVRRRMRSGPQVGLT